MVLPSRAGAVEMSFPDFIACNKALNRLLCRLKAFWKVRPASRSCWYFGSERAVTADGLKSPGRQRGRLPLPLAAAGVVGSSAGFGLCGSGDMHQARQGNGAAPCQIKQALVPRPWKQPPAEVQFQMQDQQD